MFVIAGTVLAMYGEERNGKSTKPGKGERSRLVPSGPAAAPKGGTADRPPPGTGKRPPLPLIFGGIGAAVLTLVGLIAVMVIQDPVEDATLVRSAPLTLTLAAAVVMPVLVGVWASPFLEWAAGASQLLP